MDCYKLKQWRSVVKINDGVIGFKKGKKGAHSRKKKYV
jgi:hypothetical protein